MWYALDENKNPVKCDIEDYERMNISDRRVGLDESDMGSVSTVFLSLDHRYGDGPPELFETMVFSPESKMDIYCERYATWDDAKAGHERIVMAWKDGTLETY